MGYAVSQKIDGDYKYVDTLVYSGFTKNSAYDTNSKIDKIYTNTNIDELIAAGTLKDGYNNNWSSGISYNMDYAPNAIDRTIAEGSVGDYFSTKKAGTARITATYKIFKVSYKVKVKAK